MSLEKVREPGSGFVKEIESGLVISSREYADEPAPSLKRGWRLHLV